MLMRCCELCSQPVPLKIELDGKKRNLQHRRYCLSCSPFKAHNTRKLTITEEERRRRKVESFRAKYRKYQSKERRCRKRLLVELLGGCCQICGYNRDCPSAYHFHHRDPARKRFDVASRGLLRRWEELIAEVKKCVLLCSRCHAEVHDGLHKAMELHWTDSSAGRAKD
jgi:hypothetical protein